MIRDPREEIRFQVVWSSLISIVEEQARLLMRTAFSAVVRDSGDLSAALFDARGRMLAQAQTGTPGHVNSTAAAVPLMLEAIPVERLEDGDHLITNDPWLASGHLHDITIASPIFAKDRLVGFFACTCHQLDVGGRGQGPDAASVFEEGLAIPVLKLVKAGTVNEDLVAMIRANVRKPAEVEADILSYVAANETSAESLRRALDEQGLDDLEAIAEQILDRSRASMAEEIAKLPQGSATNEITLDSFGTPITIRCKVTVGDGEIAVDFAGSSPASVKGINLVHNYTNAYASYGVRCIVGPEIPNNSGSLSAVRVTAPEGSILNVQRPAPVCARHIIGQFLPDAVMGALAQIAPDRVPAEGSACLWGIQLRGGPEYDGHFETRGNWRKGGYEVLFFNAGGTGARIGADGLSATGFPSGVRAMPIEVVEADAPIVVWRKELRAGSAGAGKYRGGFGQSIEVSTRDGRPCGLFAMFDRTTVEAEGRAGGGDGARGALFRKSGEALEPKGLQIIPPDERLCFELPGGGGYGPAEERDAEAIEADRQAGLLDAEKPREPEAPSRSLELAVMELMGDGAVPEALTQVDAVPGDGLPEEGAQVTTLAEDALPEDEIPGDALPEDELPDDASPERALHLDALAGDAQAEEALPKEELPSDEVPGDEVPEGSVPEEAQPEEASNEGALSGESEFEDGAAEETVGLGSADTQPQEPDDTASSSEPEVEAPESSEASAFEQDGPFEPNDPAEHPSDEATEPQTAAAETLEPVPFEPVPAVDDGPDPFLPDLDKPDPDLPVFDIPEKDMWEPDPRVLDMKDLDKLDDGSSGEEASGPDDPDAESDPGRAP